MEGVWGMLFQAFEYDIEFRLELQKFKQPSCIFRNIFCMMVMFDKLASGWVYKTNLAKATNEQIHKMLEFLSLKILNKRVYFTIS